MSRSIPTSNRKWLKEIERAYRKAQGRVEKGTIRSDELYMLAVELAAARRGVSDEVLKEASERVAEEITENRTREDTGEYIFEFFASYIDAHVHFGYLNSFEADKVLDYVTTMGDIFLDGDFGDDDEDL